MRVRIAGNVPSVVASGPVHAAMIRAHAAGAPLTLNVGLQVRNSAELDDVIRAASTPGSASYGHYLSAAAYAARYAPTSASVASVEQWLQAAGLRVTSVSPDRLLVSVQGSTDAIERAFSVSVGDYREGARDFYSNDVAPAVPASLGIRWISGLDDYAVARSYAVAAVRGGGFFPHDFQTGYNTGGRTTTQGIGFTLWGAPVQQSDLTTFATHTTTTPLVISAPGANGLDFIPCSQSACTLGGTQDGDVGELDETALDVESAHGIAPGAHLKYWLASTSDGHPFVASLENAVNAAANDTAVKVVSNSWGIPSDGFDPNMDASLQHAAASGKTFFFSTGDLPEISYPATSPYVVAVGGTTLNLASGSFAYQSESTWSAAGRGCSSVFARPSWQTGVGSAPTCSGRAEPDVSADANPATGAYVYYEGGAAQIGGTSLAAPLWAGMTADWAQARIDASKPALGFATPALYLLANNPAVYHQIFHDVTTGATGGVPARSGWDEATGWGSPNLAKLIQIDHDLITTSTSLHSSRNPATLGATAVTYTATVSPTPSGGTVTFKRSGVAIGGCTGKTLSAGHASCSIFFSQAGRYGVSVSYTGDATHAGNRGSTITQVVGPVPPPPAGYWMVGSTGAVYGFGLSKWHGNAPTTGVTHLEPAPSRQGYYVVNRAGQVFAFGSAHSLGNASGLAAGETVSSLSVTPSGNGYWLFTSHGRALTFGDAHFYGDMSSVALNQPVIGSVATPTGHGYYMVAADGGIFTFGDAAFYGSTGAIRLNRPVNGIVPTPTNRGYWLVASDGGIFAFGDAAFHGSMGGSHLNQPVVGMVRYGNGYLMVASDGGVFDFSTTKFLGSLGGVAVPAPIVGIAS
ncbi:MAG TPA: protease pro-enzyme activation domain-containing protein [Acidimicrobiia bacterium]|nr:protease pro-enzyme activation domain-containing protein [Acidimicrobiia bacterium]